MSSYNREECESNDLERWENEGGRVIKRGAEKASCSRNSQGLRFKKGSRLKKCPKSFVHDVSMPTPLLHLR